MSVVLFGIGDTAADEAAAKNSIIGGSGILRGFELTEVKLTEAEVSPGVLSWDGRCVINEHSKAVSWHAPRFYKKIWICVKYAKNTTNNVETVSFDIVESAEQTSAQTADALAFTLDTVISLSSSEAWLPLISATISAEEVIGYRYLIGSIPSLTQSGSRCAELKDVAVPALGGDIAAEKAVRQEQCATLGKRITKRENAVIQPASGENISGYLRSVNIDDRIYRDYPRAEEARLVIINIAFDYEGSTYIKQAVFTKEQGGTQLVSFMCPGSLYRYTREKNSTAYATDKNGITELTYHVHNLQKIAAPCDCSVSVSLSGYRSYVTVSHQMIENPVRVGDTRSVFNYSYDSNRVKIDSAIFIG